MNQWSERFRICGLHLVLALTRQTRSEGNEKHKIILEEAACWRSFWIGGSLSGSPVLVHGWLWYNEKRRRLRSAVEFFRTHKIPNFCSELLRLYSSFTLSALNEHTEILEV